MQSREGDFHMNPLFLAAFLLASLAALHAA
jgi:hypothetical protein